MIKKIHYENNIFFLRSIIRVLDDAIQLDINPEYFAEKIIDDVIFLHSSIEKLYLSLKNNSRLINNEIYMHHIMKVKKSFTLFLDNLLNSKKQIYAILEDSYPKLEKMTAEHLIDIQDIKEKLGASSKLRIDTEIISHDELDMLMSPLEDPAEV